MSRKTILLIEDEPDILELMQFNLERDGFRVVSAVTGEQGYRLARELGPDLIVLDLMLPDMSGIKVCKLLRQQDELPNLPIIIATARDSESDVVVGLELGADDYITKPFSVRELSARIRAVLRRAQPSSSDPSGQIVRAGPLELDPARHETRIHGQPVELTLAEFRLLAALAGAPGRVFTRDQLLDRITGGQATIIDRNVDVHIRALRRKLGSEAALIATIRGVGYKFTA